VIPFIKGALADAKVGGQEIAPSEFMRVHRSGPPDSRRCSSRIAIVMPASARNCSSSCSGRTYFATEQRPLLDNAPQRLWVAGDPMDHPKRRGVRRAERTGRPGRECGQVSHAIAAVGEHHHQVFDAAACASSALPTCDTKP